MTVGERIREKRIELGLTQEELAKKLGYTSRTAISNVEKNKEDLTTARVRKFADALGVEPAYLMGWTEETQKTVDHIKEAIELTKAPQEKRDQEFFKKASQDRTFMSYANKLYSFMPQYQQDVYNYIDFIETKEKSGEKKIYEE